MGKQAQGHIMFVPEPELNLVFLFPSQLVAFEQWQKF